MCVCVCVSVCVGGGGGHTAPVCIPHIRAHPLLTHVFSQLRLLSPNCAHYRIIECVVYVRTSPVVLV